MITCNILHEFPFFVCHCFFIFFYVSGLATDPLMVGLQPEPQREGGEMKITRAQYTLWCLIQARLVDPSLLTPIFHSFDMIDHERTGELTMVQKRRKICFGQNIGIIRCFIKHWFHFPSCFEVDTDLPPSTEHLNPDTIYPDFSPGSSASKVWHALTRSEHDSNEERSLPHIIKKGNSRVKGLLKTAARI